MKHYELNMDGLIGSTHHYAGLAPGNLASTTNALSVANPQAAALQGLQKMRLLHNMGIKQAFIPPQQRPNLKLMHQLGFTGTPTQQINQIARVAPELLSACYSASSMWTANAATVSPSMDCADHRVHFTAANLITNLHRHQEGAFSKRVLETIFYDQRYFYHHDLLPKSLVTSDEGAANHSRLCSHYDKPGIHLFVYGKKALGSHKIAPVIYPARQTYESCQIIARQHGLNPDNVIFAQQHPDAIDHGVFHNDVIAVANESVLLVHELAYVNQKNVINDLKSKSPYPLSIIEISNDRLNLTEIVSSYLFNSQLITLPNEKMALISPIECQINSRVADVIDGIIADSENPISEVHYIDLKQSMRNGGGPACLRLRVLLNEHELESMHQSSLINDTLLDSLEQWVKRHYRTALHSQDLADPDFMEESLRALDDLSSLLHLGALYPFQREMT